MVSFPVAWYSTVLFTLSLLLALERAAAHSHDHDHHHDNNPRHRSLRLRSRRGYSHHHYHHHHHDYNDQVEPFGRDLQANENETGTDFCGTRTPMEAELNQEQQDLEEWLAIHGECTGTSCPYLDNLRGGEENTININVYWHRIATDSGTEAWTNSQIRSGISILNSEFANAGFSFTWEGLDQRNSSILHDYTISEESTLKSNRFGSRIDLNVWSVGTYTSNGITPCGYATFPWNVDSDFEIDGVVVDYGSADSSSSTGDCLVHEVGHWLGLLHTFQDGCSGSGDFVDDTPAQSDPSNQWQTSCQASSTISCTSGGSFTPNNHMDYAHSVCTNTFTNGQITRMNRAYALYRGPTTPAPTPSPTSAPTCKPNCGDCTPAPAPSCPSAVTVIRSYFSTFACSAFNYNC